jgi:RHS repeat-associated protein
MKRFANGVELEQIAFEQHGPMRIRTNKSYGQNRRMVIESRAGVPPAARRREQWTHLPDGRWIERIVSTNNGTAYYPAFTNRYVWDGQVLLAVLDDANNLVVSFLRGLDLSGTLEGAGGVGGLLAVHDSSTLNNQPSTHFVCYDGNGNVTALVNVEDGTETARYEYGPFGEPLRLTGPMAKLNPIRFSTQYSDDVTGDLKYLFRDYDADIGRWPSRDPLEEQGGLNLYGFVNNDSPNSIDYIGLTEISVSAGVGLGLHAGGSISLKTSQEHGLKVIELTAEGSAGVGIGLKGHVKAFGKSFGLNFDFEGPSLKRSQTVKLTIACDGYINFHESIDLIRLSADQQFSAGIGLGFVAINAAVGVHVNGGIAWEINAVPHVISTWLEWNGELGGYYKITGGFGEHTDAVLAEGHTPDSHEFHKLLFGPLIYRF